MYYGNLNPRPKIGRNRAAGGYLKDSCAGNGINTGPVCTGTLGWNLGCGCGIDDLRRQLKEL